MLDALMEEWRAEPGANNKVGGWVGGCGWWWWWGGCVCGGGGRGGAVGVCAAADACIEALVTLH